MEINRHNFEAFLLDRLEGRLSVENQQLLDEFLRQNPDCALEMMKGKPCYLEAEKIQFPDIKVLKKEFPDGNTLLSDSNFDLFSIARMEGDLTREQEETHQALINDDVRKADLWMEWQKTRLNPGSLVYKDKKQLYHRKKSRNRVIWISVLASAAALALLIMLFRTGPMLQHQEFSQELQPETQKEQGPDSPDQAKSQKTEDGSADNQAVQNAPTLQTQRTNRSAMFSVKKEHEQVVEIRKHEPLEDDILAHPIKISENILKQTSPAGEIVSDRIKPLQIPPVAIHLSSLSIAQLSEMDLQELLDDYNEERGISFWSIASAGIKGINRITGSDISLMASHDKEGEISGFQLKSRHFSMTRPLGREE
jgi:hypothetical protein